MSVGNDVIVVKPISCDTIVSAGDALAPGQPKDWGREGGRRPGATDP